MKYKWIGYLADRLPEHIKEERREAIKGYFAGSSRQLEEKVKESLCRQLKIVLIFTVLFLFLLFIMALYFFLQDRNIVITRNPRGEDAKEETLEIEADGKKDSYHLMVRPKGYRPEEIGEAFQRAEQYLDDSIKGENESINDVDKPLFLPEKIPGENIQIRWESEDPSVVDEEGNVFSNNVKKPVIVSLKAEASCQGETKVFMFPVCVIPENRKQKKTQRQTVIEEIKKLEETNLSKDTFSIPRELTGGKVFRESGKKNIAVWAFFGVCAVLFFWNKEKEICRKNQRRAEDDSCREYSAIIQRLVLFLETGMSIPSAMEEIYKEYKSGKKEIFVYEVIGKSCRQLQLGVAQEEVFQSIGSQVRLEPYRKLSTILIQNITRGSDELFVQLKAEEEQAFFERKEQAKRRGEEASTKLLAPMIIMLVVILALLMFPALATFT